MRHSARRRSRALIPLATVLSLAVPVAALAAPPISRSSSPPGTATAVRDGRWLDPATWGGRVPGAGAAVTVPAGRVVVLDGATAPLSSLLVQGWVSASEERDVAITADAVVVEGGALQIGRADRPFPRRATITLTGGTSTTTPHAEHLGTKVLGVVDGTLSLHARTAPVSWTRLAVDAPAGARTVTLEQAPGWRVGDRVVVATSSTDLAHHDVLTVSAIDRNRVTFDRGLRWARLGGNRLVDGRQVAVGAEVGLLSRSITVRSDASSATTRVGGHAMFMTHRATATVQVHGVAFEGMGQLNRVGRYPVHFHQLGDRCRSCYVRASTVSDSIQRGIVLHDVQGVEVAGNVVFDTVGHNVVVETEQTFGNTLRGNLALVNRQAVPLPTDPVLVAQNDRLPSNFWMKGSRNVVVGNTAAGAYASGFVYDCTTDGPITFHDNRAHAAMDDEGPGEGVFDLAAGVLLHVCRLPMAEDSIRNTVAYHNMQGLWPELDDLDDHGFDPHASPGLVIEGAVLFDNLATELLPRGDTNRATVRDAVFARGVTGPAKDGPAVIAQYGSHMVLERPVFVGYRQPVYVSSDANGPTASSVVMSGARVVGGSPLVGVPDEQTATTYLDDSLWPRGTYLPVAFASLTPGCPTVRFAVPDDDEVLWYVRCDPSFRVPASFPLPQPAVDDDEPEEPTGTVGDGSGDVDDDPAADDDHDSHDHDHGDQDDADEGADEDD